MGIKKTLLLIDTAAVMLAVIVSLSLGSAKAIFVGGPSDPKSNSVIPGGVHTTDALINDFDSSACVRDVFAHFGVTASMVHNLPSTNQVGLVTKTNQVFVGSNLKVADNAVTGGWDNIAGSTSVRLCGRTFFERSPSVSFLNNSLPAFVSMVNGRFAFAVLASCGNVVIATPVNKPAPKPAPPPKPASPSQPTPTINNTNNNVNVQNQSQSQSQQVVVNQPAPAETETSAQATTPATTSTSSVEASTKPASSLPNTGPSSILGLFGFSSLIGLLGHHFLSRRRTA